MPKPILCGKCGTSSDVWPPLIITTFKFGNPIGNLDIRCGRCGHSVSSDSLPAALAKFEERVEAPK